MKVVCIDNIPWVNKLTIGKTYEVININEYDQYFMIDDDGYRTWSSKRFKTLSEVRNDTINKLLEDEN